MQPFFLATISTRTVVYFFPMTGFTDKALSLEKSTVAWMYNLERHVHLYFLLTDARVDGFADTGHAALNPLGILKALRVPETLDIGLRRNQ